MEDALGRHRTMWFGRSSEPDESSVDLCYEIVAGEITAALGRNYLALLGHLLKGSLCAEFISRSSTWHEEAPAGCHAEKRMCCHPQECRERLPAKAPELCPGELCGKLWMLSPFGTCLLFHLDAQVPLTTCLPAEGSAY